MMESMFRIWVADCGMADDPEMVCQECGAEGCGLREATPADVTAAFLAQVKASGAGDVVRAILRDEREDPTSTGYFSREVLGALGLSALLPALEGGEL